MTNEKAFQFLDSVIAKTKNQDIFWNNLYNAVTLNSRFPDLIFAFSFFANIPNGCLVLGRTSLDDINLYIIPDEQPSYNFADLITDSSDVFYVYQSKIQRLYDMVYSSLPSIDSFMDNFLNG